MAAVQAMTGAGGWPMSVFLTPDGGRSTAAPTSRTSRATGCRRSARCSRASARAWREQRAEVEAAGRRLVGDARRAAAARRPARRRRPDAGAPRRRATPPSSASFDAGNGGWGGAPKFPQPMTIEYLLRRMAAGDARARRDGRASTLDAMADGGIRDQLGGGFHRYSTDAHWLVPHFEQMLYDNAQLARVYMHAWALTGDARYREVATGTLDYMIRELTTDDGAFAASQDADTDGIEGLTFTWRARRDPRGAGRRAPAVRRGLRRDRRRATGRASRSCRGSGRTPTLATVSRRRGVARRRLAARPGAPARATGDAAAAGARRQGAGGLERAGDRGLRRGGGALLGRRRRCTAAADRAAAARTIVGRAARRGRVARPVVEGRPGGRAGRARGLRASGRWPARAVRGDLRRALVRRPRGRSMDRVLARFADPAGGFFDTADDHERLVTRPKDVQDNAVPSGNAMASPVLLRLAAWTGEARYRDAARTGAAHGRAVRRALPDRVRPVAVGDGPRARAGRRGRDRRRPDDPATRGARSPRSARGFRPNQVVAVGGGSGGAPSCRCWPTGSPSTAGRPPTSAAGSPAGCRCTTPEALRDRAGRRGRRRARSRPRRVSDPVEPRPALGERAGRAAAGRDRRPAPAGPGRARGPADPPAGDDGVRARRPRLPGRAGGPGRRGPAPRRPVRDLAGGGRRCARRRPRADPGASPPTSPRSASCSRRRACCSRRRRRVRGDRRRGARSALVGGESTFPELADELDLRLRTDLLVPLSRWVTPPSMPRRFDARFFAAELPAGATRDVRGRRGRGARVAAPGRRARRDGRRAARDVAADEHDPPAARARDVDRRDPRAPGARAARRGRGRDRRRRDPDRHAGRRRRRRPAGLCLSRRPPRVRAGRSGRPDRPGARPGARARSGARRRDRGRRADPRRSRPRRGRRGHRRAARRSRSSPVPAAGGRCRTRSASSPTASCSTGRRRRCGRPTPGPRPDQSRSSWATGRAVLAGDLDGRARRADRSPARSTRPPGRPPASGVARLAPGAPRLAGHRHDPVPSPRDGHDR